MMRSKLLHLDNVVSLDARNPEGNHRTTGTAAHPDKIRICQKTLPTFRETAEGGAALRKLDVALMELDTMPPTVKEARMIEARTTVVCFTHWREILLHWKETGRKPIPPEWHRVELRKGL